MRRSLGVGASVLLIGASLTAPARAAPANDDFHQALDVRGSGTYVASNEGATEEPGEPDHASRPVDSSVWFRYTAPGDGIVTIEARSDSIVPVAAVYRGSSVGALTEVVSDDSDGGITRATFEAVEGATYRIAVDSETEETGPFELAFETELPSCDLLGTEAADTLSGTASNETLCGLGGADVLRGGGGNDLILGGEGDDLVAGGDGHDELDGGSGTDAVTYRNVRSGVRVDLARGRARGAGNDRLVSIEGITGSSGDDRIVGDLGPNQLRGGPGADVVVGDGGPDNLAGGSGNDRLVPGRGDDDVAGGPGRDLASFGRSPRPISADLAFGRARGEGTDSLSGVEDLLGSRRADVLRGDRRANRLRGGRGADLVSGLGGRDAISGGRGHDRLYAGPGGGSVAGGPGSDRCHPRACERRLRYADWLPVVAGYRRAAALPPVMERPTLSAGAVKHARYVVKTDRGGHDEDPSSRWYSEAGADAGASGNVYWTTDADRSDAAAISTWMTGPFHAIGILRPGLAEVGYGAYRERSSPLYRMAAVLNVLDGLEPPRASARPPIMFPGDGRTTRLTAYTGGEVPDPLTSCPGYRAPSGLPILLLVGERPRVTSHSLMRGSARLPHCVFDGTDYRNPDPAQRTGGRGALGNTIVVVPRDPLVPGARYRVRIRSSGTLHSWTFTVRR